MALARFPEEGRKRPITTHNLIVGEASYTVDALCREHDVIDTNGETTTSHVSAYLGDGWHKGTISSAFRVAQLIG